MDHLEQAQEQDNSMDQELYKFRAIIGHEGPLKMTDRNWEGSKYNVQIEWEAAEMTFDPLIVIAADDPITCAAYAKEKISIILMAEKDLGILSRKRNN